MGCRWSHHLLAPAPIPSTAIDRIDGTGRLLRVPLLEERQREPPRVSILAAGVTELFKGVGVSEVDQRTKCSRILYLCVYDGMYATGSREDCRGRHF